jgi:hypothetical protein
VNLCVCVCQEHEIDVKSNLCVDVSEEEAVDRLQGSSLGYRL